MNYANEFETYAIAGLLVLFILTVYHVCKRVYEITRSNKGKIDIDKYRSMR